MAKATAFATFLIVGPTCFFLGILFASLPYDYHVIWSVPRAEQIPPPFPSNPTDASQAADQFRPWMDMLEHHLRVLHASPPLVSRVLHTVIALGLFGLIAKLYKPTQANMLFDGASLVLYVIGIAVYITNLVKGMRVVTLGVYGVLGPELMDSQYLDPSADAVRKSAEAAEQPPGDVQVLGKDDSLRVMAASDTILAVILVGVLVLQAGQWYAQRREDAEIEALDRADAAKKKAQAAAAAAAGDGKGDKKKQ